MFAILIKSVPNMQPRWLQKSRMAFSGLLGNKMILAIQSYNQSKGEMNDTG